MRWEAVPRQLTPPARLPQALTNASHAAYWTAVREAFWEPFVAAGAVPPLLVVAHRFAWDLPRFNQALAALAAQVQSTSSQGPCALITSMHSGPPPLCPAPPFHPTRL